MKRFLVALVFSMLLAPTVLAACVDNGICSPDEVSLGCADCTFGVNQAVCVDDGACTYAEKAAGCGDCTPKHVLVADEKEDTQASTMAMTGFVTMGVSALAVLFGFFVIIVIAISAMKLAKHNKRRNIRL